MRAIRQARRGVAAIRVAPVLVLLALVVAGCGSGDGGGEASASSPPPHRTPTAPGVTVRMASFKFLPKTIRVGVGGTVTWINEDAAPHTASDRSPDGAYDTGTLRRGGRGIVRFDKPGRYRYYCAFHPFMEGTVDVVKETR